jgi:hypothetical protein
MALVEQAGSRLQRVDKSPEAQYEASVRRVPPSASLRDSGRKAATPECPSARPMSSPFTALVAQ